MHGADAEDVPGGGRRRRDVGGRRGAGERCDGDRDGDGEDDEDENDRFGVIVSFDAETGALVVDTLAGATITVTVNEETEVEFEDAEDDEEGTLADLRAGLTVAELELDEDTGQVEEIELYAA